MEIADASGGLWLRPGWDGGQGYQFQVKHNIDVVEAGSAVSEYIWIFYNRKRIHEANGCLTPEEYCRIHQTDLKVA